MILSSPPRADDQGPGSSKGGKAVDEAPAGVKLTTLLPGEDLGRQQFAEDGCHRHGEERGNQGQRRDQASGRRFRRPDGQERQGCSAMAEKDLPEGSNSGFICPIGNLAAGESKSYAVDATFDLSKTGKICLPVQTERREEDVLAAGPGPVRYDEPVAERPGHPAAAGHRQQAGGTRAATAAEDRCRSRGPLPLGAAGAALMSAGAAGLWWSGGGRGGSLTAGRTPDARRPAGYGRKPARRAVRAAVASRTRASGGR